MSKIEKCKPCYAQGKTPDKKDCEACKTKQEQEKIKRSECPHGGIDCAWCTEDCE